MAALFMTFCLLPLKAKSCQKGSTVIASNLLCFPLLGREAGGGAMVLGKFPGPGRPTNLGYIRARAYCAYSRCGGVCLDILSLIYHSSLLSPSLWETARCKLKYCL